MKLNFNNLNLMKKILLTISAAIIGIPFGVAQEVQEFPGYMFNSISPDGTYAVSTYFQEVSIINLTTGEEAMAPSELDYGVGAGDVLSNFGTLVGVNETTLVASYCKNGTWHAIESASKRSSSYAQGISADDTIIVGSVAPDSYQGNYEGLIIEPCYWQLQSDGTYGEAVLLPFPDKDLTGRTPQYVTAIRISDDLKTIAGQIVDYTGTICQPIIYTQDESGEWTYSLPMDEVFHPANIQFPPYPGDDSPRPIDYMTDQEKEEYLEALENWDGNYDYYPQPGDFMTPAEIAEFNAASSKWSKEFDDFMEVYYKLAAQVPLFSFNNVFLSRDGKYYASTDVKYYFNPSTFETYSLCTPYLINLADDTYVSYPDSDTQVIISSLCNNGTILGEVLENEIYQAYILPAGEASFIPLVEYEETVNPEVASWMKENMTHKVYTFDPVTYQEYYIDVIASGIPYATSDLSTVALGSLNTWSGNYNSPDYYPCFSYCFHNTSGIETIESNTGEATIRGLKGGILTIEGNIASISVFNLSGSEVWRSKVTSSAMETNLSSGIYIIQATTQDGKTIVRKVIL